MANELKAAADKYNRAQLANRWNRQAKAAAWVVYTTELADIQARYAAELNGRKLVQV